MKIKRVNPKCFHHKEKIISFLSLYIIFMQDDVSLVLTKLSMVNISQYM